MAMSKNLSKFKLKTTKLDIIQITMKEKCF